MPHPLDLGAEPLLIGLVLWLKLVVEAMGALVIAIGVGVAAWQFARAATLAPVDGFTRMRLTLARYLVLALELQLGADILSTAVAPGWEQIGQLGATAVIRTALNYFLAQELRQEEDGIREGVAPGS